MNIKNIKIFDYLLYFFVIAFCASFFLKINYVLSTRDEIIYLSDSLLVLEGLVPTHSYAPAGLSTWLGSVVVLIDFLINQISLESIQELFKSFDLTLYKHYSNLTYIKFSLFLLNSILILYFFLLDKTKFFFLLFSIFFLLPQINNITFSGAPFFTACAFCAISFMLKDKNKLISLIFFGLALSERIEFLLLINFVCLENTKFKIKNYFFVLITFIVVSPWFGLVFLQNIKNVTSIFYNMSQDGNEKNIITIISLFLLIFFVLMSFGYSFFRDTKVKKTLLIFFSFTAGLFYFLEIISLRWLLPIFLILSYETSLLIKDNLLLTKNNLIKIFLILISFGLLINFNNKNFISDDKILLAEINSKNSVIGIPLLKEKLNYENYQNTFGNYIKSKNINNINFFKDEDSPLALGISGNLVKKHNRRYQYLAIYGSKVYPMKYVFGNSGLHWPIKKWCKILNTKNINIFHLTSDKFSNCQDF